MRVFFQLIQVEQTLLGLPWALVGALFPFFQFSPHVSFLKWVWIVVAFSSARVAGMSLNRLIDYAIDRDNPRTRMRPLQQAVISKQAVMITALLSLALFFLSTFLLGKTVFTMAFVVALLLWGYSYTKRFTPLCHFVLGLIEFFVPVLAWIAVMGSVGAAALWLGLCVLLWISGIDIMYATQDRAFDEQAGLYSMPVVLGCERSLTLARYLHIGMVVSLVAAGISAAAPLFYYLGLLGVIPLLIYQHKRAHSFGASGILSVAQFLFTLLAVVWRE